MIQRIEDVKRPVKQGEYYSVPCIVADYGDKLYVSPVFNNPHSDIESGQTEVHYHVDYRFVKHTNEDFIAPINNHSKHIFAPLPRVELVGINKMERIVLPVINEDFAGITKVSLIKNAKLKRKCIHQGKCPHKGYDLSQVAAKDGVIICPLHGLEFDEQTGELI